MLSHTGSIPVTSENYELMCISCSQGVEYCLKSSVSCTWMISQSCVRVSLCVCVCLSACACVCLGESQRTRGAAYCAGAPGPDGAPGLWSGCSQRSLSMCLCLCGSSRDDVLNSFGQGGSERCLNEPVECRW